MKNNTSENYNLLPHRYDPIRDEIHFIKATREDQRAAVFLTDEYLQEHSNPHRVKRKTLTQPTDNNDLHFIFHSGYCCSTLLARAFDIPGTSMGLKEPVILNDIVGWRSRKAPDFLWNDVLKDTLALLSRPMTYNEAVIIKPSSLVNVIAPKIMQTRINSNALLLYAPLEDFLGSIARKGMWGRLWVRELMSKQLRDGMIDLGIPNDDYIRLTDLQAPAVCWLSQQSLFHSMQKQFAKERVLSMDCSTLLKSPQTILKNICSHFELKIDDQKLGEIASGPTFTNHSKTNIKFNKRTRESDRLEGQTLHAEEIEKVFAWSEIVARNSGVPMKLA